MADLTGLQASQTVKIAGAPNTGIEDNYADVDFNNNLKVISADAGPVTPGTAAANSGLVGGQFNASLPTLTTGQQSAIQLDSSGRLLIRPLTSSDVVSAAQSGTWTIQQGTPPWSVVGNVASGATDSGNPVKVGMVFNTTPPTPTSGNRVDLQSNMNGALSVSQRNQYKNVTGNGTTTVKSGAGVLQVIMINNAGSGGTMAIYDNTTASGSDIIATLTLPTGGVNPVPAAMFGLGCEFSVGLTVVTAGSALNNFTLVYQ